MGFQHNVNLGFCFSTSVRSDLILIGSQERHLSTFHSLDFYKTNDIICSLLTAEECLVAVAEDVTKDEAGMGAELAQRPGTGKLQRSC